MALAVSTDPQLTSGEDLMTAVQDRLPMKSLFGRGLPWGNAAGDVCIVRTARDCGPICVVPKGVFGGLPYLMARAAAKDSAFRRSAVGRRRHCAHRIRGCPA